MTILRRAEHAALSSLTLSGTVLDLGGDTRSEYRSLFKGDFTIITANLDEKTKPDLLVDLEEVLPIPDERYDAVLLINVLEHIFNFSALLHECARVLRPGGKIIIVVPYMFPYHPSPSDFHRFSKIALERHLATASFSPVSLVTLGTGVFAARWLFLERLLPSSLQVLLSPFTSAVVAFSDVLFSGIASLLGKKYEPSDYALGFCVTATKP